MALNDASQLPALMSIQNPIQFKKRTWQGMAQGLSAAAVFQF